MTKLDPRADPVTHPPAKSEDFSVDRVQITIKNAPKSAPVIRSAEPTEAVQEETLPEPRSATRPITSSDPRYASVEKLLDINDWKSISAELGSLDDVGKLPPNLGLLAALAHNEATAAGHPESVATAIRCVAAIFGVPEESPIARVLARRILRKNPVKLRDRPAPPARVSLLIIAVTLVLCGGVAWFFLNGGMYKLMKLFH